MSELVDALDLSKFYQCYEGDGGRISPLDPRRMINIILYAHATTVFSSRKRERKLSEDVVFRILAGRNFPKHQTIRDFRKAFEALPWRVVLLVRERGFPD